MKSLNTQKNNAFFRTSDDYKNNINPSNTKISKIKQIDFINNNKSDNLTPLLKPRSSINYKYSIHGELNSDNFVDSDEIISPMKSKDRYFESGNIIIPKVHKDESIKNRRRPYTTDKLHQNKLSINLINLISSISPSNNFKNYRMGTPLLKNNRKSPENMTQISNDKNDDLSFD